MPYILFCRHGKYRDNALVRDQETGRYPSQLVAKASATNWRMAKNASACDTSTTPPARNQRRQQASSSQE